MGLIVSLFRILRVRIKSLEGMLVWELSVWVVLHLAAPTVVTPECLEFYKLGRALRVTLPTGSRGGVHLFVVYGYQEVEEDSEKLLLTDKLLRAVLAQAQVVCVGQPEHGQKTVRPHFLPCLDVFFGLTKGLFSFCGACDVDAPFRLGKTRWSWY